MGLHLFKPGVERLDPKPLFVEERAHETIAEAAVDELVISADRAHRVGQ